jgi:hypothetical protein
MGARYPVLKAPFPLLQSNSADLLAAANPCRIGFPGVILSKTLKVLQYIS